MGHHHHHEKDLKSKKLLWVTILNFSITIVQIFGGIVSNSISLISDAIHNLGDSSAIFIAFLAGRQGKRKPNAKKTFGYKRIEILAAFFNAIVLISICVFLFYEAIQRFIHPEPIKGKIMFIVASFGLLANLLSVFVLHKDKNHNLNIKVAYLHLLGDTLSSIAVIAGGVAIWLFNAFWLDPLITILVGIYIIFHTWQVLKQAVDILMQAAPENIKIDDLKHHVESQEGIDNIHHLHLWKLDDKQVFLEAHINLSKNIDMIEMMQIKNKIEKLLHDSFSIEHTTLQFGYNCCNGMNNLIIERESIN